MKGTPREPTGEAPLVEASVLNRLQAEEFAAADDLSAFCEKWLSLNCSTVRGCRAGAVLPLRAGQLRWMTSWPGPGREKDPAKRALARLTAVAKAAQVEGGGVLLDNRVLASMGSPLGTHCLAVPIEIEGNVWGYAALEVTAADQEAVRGILERLQWATGWFCWFQFRQRDRRGGARQRRLQTAIDLLASVSGHDRFKQAALALVNELAPRFSCDRVSAGVLRHHQIKLVAISGATILDQKQNVSDRLGAAMEEALDQEASIRFPLPEGLPAAQRLVVRQHRILCSESETPKAALTVLMLANFEPVGAVTLERERSRPFRDEEVEVLEATAELLGPLIELQRREDRFIGTKVADSLKSLLTRLLGPGHVGSKATALAVLALIVFFCFAKWDYRVSAGCLVEAAVLRASSAPFDGFLREAPVRAGDLVAGSQIMAVLEDRELRQRRLEILSRRNQLLRLYRKAMGDKEVAERGILSSQLEQVAAELALIEERLELTRIRAPFDGVVVAGDLSQALGAPVTQGQVLFETAPLDRFRLVLQVDERDVDELEVGQAGEFRLLSRPRRTYPFRVSLVTPVSRVDEGRNVFRVEAQFEERLDWLRPGMEGVAKVQVGRRLIIWLWTHRILDFARVYLWM